MLEKSTSFDTWMRDRQIAWRNNSDNVECREQGEQNGGRYPWILPSDKWEQSLWPGIRTGTSNSLPDYLAKNGIQAHLGKHNLKSSWVLCANLYFPFRETAEGRALLAGFLREHVSKDVQTVMELHLEYAEDGDLNPSALLGETDGKRGSGQTSPDLAFHINGGQGLILVESKLTEHSFYPCSARKRMGKPGRPGNPDPKRCLNVSAVMADPVSQCHQCHPEWGRKYWPLLLPSANREALVRLTCCPATFAGYQLFRQQALAEGIANRGSYDFVYSCVALDARNKALLDCLVETGISDLETGWATLFNGKVHFKVFEHQQWVTWVKDHGDMSVWRAWLIYVTDRYGY